MKCLFKEPWIGPCQKETVNGFCCEKHAQEKCQVCGEQALTRCQASIGMMCGIPLCHFCGVGEMCLHHQSGHGPLEIIRYLVGGGPVLNIFTTVESQASDRERVAARMEAIRGMFTTEAKS